jgi:hypothetical protein
MQRALPLSLLLSGLLFGCSGEDDPPATQPEPQLRPWPCEVAEGAPEPDALEKVGCRSDYDLLASQPLDASIPGARSGKVILDLCADNLCESKKLYFQNSNLYPIHYNYASEFLDDPTSPLRHVPAIGEFNAEYTKPYSQRRFLLGAVTYYEGPNVWALEIAPYDTSTAAMVEELYDAVRDQSFFGDVLAFHPTSDGVARVVPDLPKDVRVVTTEDLYKGIDYQPLNLGEVLGPIRFVKSEDLDSVYVTSRDIVVLNSVPNDISPVNGLITEEFQTPLSHINVLARNRGTPNMGLRNARVVLQDQGFRDGDHVRLVVGPFEYKVEPVSVDESEAWWIANLPPMVTVPAPDTTVKDLRDIEDVTVHTDEPPYVEREAILVATRQYGAKAAQYSVFATDPRVPHKKAFAIPVYYYDQFMEENGLWDEVDAFAADEEFQSDTAVRDAKLQALRDKIKDPAVTSMSEEFSTALKAKLDADYPGRSIRFRSSTNAEDLSGFPCAGCYDSHTGDPTEFDGDQLAAAFDAIRKTFATVWNLRTYDERQLRQIEHDQVMMALLVHTNFPAEEANGVAITDNIFDQSGNSPGFYVNVQEGGTYEVVHPPPGITSDSFLFQHSFPNQPIIYYTHSNVTVPAGSDVLTTEQIHALGDALAALNDRFRHAFGTTDGTWWAMDSEFKFDDEANPGTQELYIKQARPYPKGKSE